LVAVTLKVYDVPFVNPVTVQLVPSTASSTHVAPAGYATTV